jgi:hypothetical protein
VRQPRFGGQSKVAIVQRRLWVGYGLAQRTNLVRRSIVATRDRSRPRGAIRWVFGERPLYLQRITNNQIRSRLRAIYPYSLGMISMDGFCQLIILRLQSLKN